MAHSRIFVEFVFEDPDLRGPYQLTKLKKVFNYEPDCEDFIEGGKDHLIGAIQNVILHSLPPSVNLMQRQMLQVQLMATEPSEIIIRSIHGDIYNFDSLPSYFGECLDHDPHCKRIVLQIKFCRPLEPSNPPPLAPMISSSICTSNDTNSSIISTGASGQKLNPDKENIPIPKNEEDVMDALPTLIYTEDSSQKEKNKASEAKLSQSSSEDHLSVEENHEIKFTDIVSANLNTEETSTSRMYVEKDDQNQETKFIDIASAKLNTEETSTSRMYTEKVLYAGAFVMGIAARLTPVGYSFQIGCKTEALCPIAQFSKTLKMRFDNNERGFKAQLMLKETYHSRTVSTARLPKLSMQELEIGQELDGVVVDFSDGGIFIDIGCGKDALYHHFDNKFNRKYEVGDCLKVKVKSLNTKHYSICDCRIGVVDCRAKLYLQELEIGQQVDSENKQNQQYEVGDRFKVQVKSKRDCRVSVVDCSISGADCGDQLPKLPTQQLEIGQQLDGTIVAINQTGVFIDIGCGKDALYHHNENKYNRIYRVGDDLKVEVKFLRANESTPGYCRIGVVDCRDDQSHTKIWGTIIEGTVKEVRRNYVVLDIDHPTYDYDAVVKERCIGDSVREGDSMKVRLLKLYTYHKENRTYIEAALLHNNSPSNRRCKTKLDYSR